MNTAEELKIQFGSIHPLMIDIAAYYLNMDEAVAKRQAAKGALPFKVFKASGSQKANWVTDVRDVASWLEERRRK